MLQILMMKILIYLIVIFWVVFYNFDVISQNYDAYVLAAYQSALNPASVKLPEPVCTHGFTDELTVRYPTCETVGYMLKVCSLCDAELETIELAPLGHTYLDPKTTVLPTPLNYGVIRSTCWCGAIHDEYEVYEPRWDNTLYVPSIGLDAELTPAAFTQQSVDSYDIVISEIDIVRPATIILGHDYNTLGIIYDIAIDDQIFLITDGKLEIYTVEVSEEAIPYRRTIDGKTKTYNFHGVDTGAWLYDYRSGEILLMYTCYGDHNWIVVSKRDYELESRVLSGWELAEVDDSWRS